MTDRPDSLADEEPPAEPCPAAFDHLAVRLQSWPTAATLDLWAEAGEAASREWSGPRRLVKGGNRGAVALEAPTRKVQTWQELRARIGLMEASAAGQ